jgi:membrane associated rhomboid family serine protease/Tfp pilus assembly protein PilF
MRTDEEMVCESRVSDGKSSELPVKQILVGLNLAAFLATLIYGAYSRQLHSFSFAYELDAELLRQAGANYGPDTLGGQYWRIITAIFLHSDIWQLALNMGFLWYFARALNRFLSQRIIFILYLVVGSAGSILGVWSHPTDITVGASGAVLGLNGALILLIRFAKEEFSGNKAFFRLTLAIFLAAVSLISGHFSRQVSNATHIGGFASGLIIGGFLAWILRSSDEARSIRQRRLFAGSSALIVCLFIITIASRGSVVELRRGRLALDANDPAASTHFEKFVAAYPNDLNGHWELAYAYSHLNQHQKAAKEYERVLEIDPGNAAAQYNLALNYYGLRRLDESVTLFRKSVSKLPPDGDKYFNFALALVAAAQLEDAKVMAEKAISLDPRSSRNHYLLSRILFAKGETDRASVEHNLADSLRTNN